MMESKVFADNFSRSFSESGDFFQFLSARQARSKWMTAPSKELRFEPVERGSTLGNLYMQIYDHNGDADVLEDTMENTSLLLKVDGKDYPVRSCALKTVLERARISGHALNKVSKSVFAEILNYCMGVASGDSLIKVADEKVSAVHGGDPKDYTVMEMLPLFKATNDFLNREYPGNRFMTAHFDHSMAIHGDAPCTAYDLFMQMSDVIFSAQCDGASGMRIAQLEEIVSRALNVNWHEYDHPGDFKW